jgi:hypothetical protein
MLFLVLKKETKKNLPKEKEFAHGSVPSRGERTEPNDNRGEDTK